VRPALSTPEHRRLADVLHSAASAGRTLPPFTRWYPELTTADGCRIRDLLIERRLADGEQLIGAKVWHCNGAAEPCVAWLTDGMLLTDTSADISGLSRPRVEPKLAFRLAGPLRGRVPSPTEVLAATEAVMPCLEIVASRFDGSPPRLADAVAENGATGMLLLAPPPADGHLRRLRVNMRVDGPPLEPAWGPVTGRVPVPPLEVVAWLADRLVAGGLTPGAGTLLVSQPTGPAVDLPPGVRVIAHFSDVGAVRLDTSGPPLSAA
jgi:2-oxopent-4-enoate/cis-2-oxohex-4-enoate hydratase